IGRSRAEAEGHARRVRLEDREFEFFGPVFDSPDALFDPPHARPRQPPPMPRQEPAEAIDQLLPGIEDRFVLDQEEPILVRLPRFGIVDTRPGQALASRSDRPPPAAGGATPETLVQRWHRVYVRVPF